MATNPGLDNLISWWSFDESSGDAADSHASNDLTNRGTTGYVAGLLGNAVDLGTANSTKSFYISSNLGLTVSASRSMGSTFKVRTEISTNGVSYTLAQITHTGNNVSYLLVYTRAGGVNQVQVIRVREGVSLTAASYNVTLGTANYHQLIYTYNGTSLLLYLDGVYVATVNPGTDNGSAARSDGFSVGCNPEGNTNFANIYADETFAFNDVLTADEVTWLWNSGACRKYNDLYGGGQVIIWKSED